MLKSTKALKALKFGQISDTKCPKGGHFFIHTFKLNSKRRPHRSKYDFCHPIIRCAFCPQTVDPKNWSRDLEIAQMKKLLSDPSQYNTKYWAEN